MNTNSPMLAGARSAPLRRAGLLSDTLISARTGKFMALRSRALRASCGRAQSITVVGRCHRTYFGQRGVASNDVLATLSMGGCEGWRRPTRPSRPAEGGAAGLAKLWMLSRASARAHASAATCGSAIRAAPAPTALSKPALRHAPARKTGSDFEDTPCSRFRCGVLPALRRVHAGPDAIKTKTRA